MLCFHTVTYVLTTVTLIWVTRSLKDPIANPTLFCPSYYRPSKNEKRSIYGKSWRFLSEGFENHWLIKLTFQGALMTTPYSVCQPENIHCIGLMVRAMFYKFCTHLNNRRHSASAVFLYDCEGHVQQVLASSNIWEPTLVSTGYRILYHQS